MSTQQLDIGQIAEVRDLYDGTRASVVELSKLFEVNFCVIAYLINHKGYRDKISKFNNLWQKNNPEKVREMNNKAIKKYLRSEKYQIYREKNRDKINTRARKYYWKNRVRLRKYRRDRYQKMKYLSQAET